MGKLETEDLTIENFIFPFTNAKNLDLKLSISNELRLDYVMPSLNLLSYEVDNYLFRKINNLRCLQDTEGQSRCHYLFHCQNGLLFCLH